MIINIKGQMMKIINLMIKKLLNYCDYEIHMVIIKKIFGEVNIIFKINFGKKRMLSI